MGKRTLTTFRFWARFCLQRFEKICIRSNDLVTCSLEKLTRSNDLVTRSLKTQGPHSHILMTGGRGGGFEWFFWVWNFGPKWFFWVYERHWDFFVSWKKQGVFLGCEKMTKGFFLGILKKSNDFYGQTNSEIASFLGIKYEPLSDPPHH